MKAVSRQSFDLKLFNAHKQRGQVVSDFAILEVDMQEFILSSYLGEVNQEMIVDVFQDTHFNFSLIQSIFLTVLKKPQHVKLFKEFKRKSLGEALIQAYLLRNIFAHGTLGFNEVVLRQGSKTLTEESQPLITHGTIQKQYKTPYRNHEVNFLFNEFYKYHNLVSLFMRKLPGVSNKTLSL